jgi:hypothetical protein
MTLPITAAIMHANPMPYQQKKKKHNIYFMVSAVTFPAYFAFKWHLAYWFTSSLLSRARRHSTAFRDRAATDILN